MYSLLYSPPQLHARLTAVWKSSQAFVKTGKALSRPQVGLICCSRQREEERVGQLLCCVGAPWACTYVTFPKIQALTAPEKPGSLDCTYATWIQRSHYLQSGTSCRAIMRAMVKGRQWVRAVPGSQWPGMGLHMVEGAHGALQPCRSLFFLAWIILSLSWGLLQLFVAWSVVSMYDTCQTFFPKCS